MPPRLRGKWALGITPRNFTWFMKDKLAVCERPGGYGDNHRRVRRQEEIIWLRENGFGCVVSIIPATHNLHNYDELGMPYLHRPFTGTDDLGMWLQAFYNEINGLLEASTKVIVHNESVDDRLIGIMGGKVFTQQATRRGKFYLVAVFYLFTVLLLWAVPVQLLDIKSLPPGLQTLATILLPMVLLSMVVLPYSAEDETSSQVFDFFYSLFIFQLVVVLVLGSIASMRATENSYFAAVLLTVLSFSGALLILAALWAPRAGYGGLRTYFSRYLMSVGMPFELWMRRIATLSEADMSSARFLETAMEEVSTMPWILGCKWTAPDGTGEFGKETEHTAQFRYHALDVTFHTESRLSPALFLHLRLLAQVVGEFYEGKRREQVIKQNAYMQAVHETGAKLTHDIKNLFVSDGSQFTTGGAENPTLTIVTLAIRQADHITKQMSARAI